MKNLILIALLACSLTSSFASTYVKSVYSLPLSFDPIKMNDTASLAAGNLIYDGLLKFSTTLEIEEALAESWSTSSDGKTLTFKLRTGIKFHDGTPITADDVVYSFNRAVSPESTVRKYYDCITGVDEKDGSDDFSKVGVKALDGRTVEIQLKNPFPAFISVLAGATAKVLPKKYKNDKKFFDAPVGSGAFQFSAIDKVNKKITLKSFESYWQGKNKISRMILHETSENTAMELAKKNELLDLVSWPIPAKNSIFESGKKITSPIAATWIIGLNTQLPPLNSLKVRNDFKASFDTDGFRKKFYPDSYPAFGYIPPGLPGYKEKNTTVTKSIMPINDKITIAIPQELAEADEMKKFIENDLRSKGWKVDVLPMAWNKLMDGYVNKKHQSFLISMNMDYPDAEFLLRNFETNNPDNFSGLSNQNLDGLIRESRAETDKKKRIELYKKAIQLLDESAVTVNLFHPRANNWHSHCVDGLKPNILSDVYIDYTKVSVDEKCLEKSRKLQ